MFFRTPPPPELTNAGYSRWLRAQRPPLQWFLGLSALEQEALACIGDAHVEEEIEALALALANPRALEAGIEVRAAAAGDAAVEESLARRLAAGMASKIQEFTRATAAPVVPPVTMPRETLAGFGERRQETHTVHGANPRPKLFGMEPDRFAAPGVVAP